MNPDDYSPSPASSILRFAYNLLARYLRGDVDAYPPFLWKCSPAPQRAGGLKSTSPGCCWTASSCPAPQGAGGLKCHIDKGSIIVHVSRPTRGGWIEITA